MKGGLLVELLSSQQPVTQKTHHKSVHECFIKSFLEYQKNPENIQQFYKTILKTKFLIPTYSKKQSTDRLFDLQEKLDYMTLQNRKNELSLPLFTTKQELSQLGSDVFPMIVSYYDAMYLSEQHGLELVINPFSINYTVPHVLMEERLTIEGVINPSMERLLKEYHRDKQNSEYISILENLQKETLYMPLCVDENQDYTLSYKEMDQQKYLCLFTSQRRMYQSIPTFQAFEPIRLNKIVNILEMMGFAGITLSEDLYISIETLTNLQNFSKK